MKQRLLLRRQPLPVVQPSRAPPERRYLHRAPPRFDQPRTRPTARRPLDQPPTPTRQEVARSEHLGRAQPFLLAALVVLTFLLRVRDAWENPIIGAEDPYLHMERTWNLLQDQPVRDYPVGFMVFLAPYALFGPDAFYTIARFLPALFGVAGVLGTFFLCRAFLTPIPSLAAALLLALMPEHVFRTNLLFPTAVDLALLPLFFLAFLQLHRGRPWTILTCVGIAVFLGLIHPWVVALLFPTVLLFGVGMLLQHREGRLVAVAGGTVAVTFLGFLLWSAPLWHPTVLIRDHALPRFLEIAANPRAIFPLPIHVRLQWMVTAPALVLATIGSVLALVHRNRLGILALLWTASLLPLALVDWFDIWYIPHRVVAFLTIGVAVLAAFPLHHVLAAIEPSNAHVRKPVGLAAVAVLLLLGLPYGLNTQAWYRNYGNDDYDAWSALDAEASPLLITGSWQGRTGYRAITGRSAEFSPAFFQDPNDREVRLRETPALVVLVDNHTRENGYDLDFLRDWQLVGRWGENEAYRR